MRFRRVLAFLATLILSISWLIPTASPSSSVANAQQLGEGYSLAGDFKGAGGAQIATLYDPNDDLGLRIVVLERTLEGKLSSSQWFLEGANRFDLGRMKPVALDLNGDGKTDIAVLYNDGNFTVHLVVWLSTGTSFTYQGNQGWWRHTNFDWNRARDLLPGLYNLATNKPGIVIPYILDNYQLKMLYIETTGSGIRYSGDVGVYDSGPGQIDVSKARFVGGSFTRATGAQQVAMIYQYPNFSIKVHVFDLDSTGNFQPMGGWTGRWTSPAGFFDITKARFGAADIDGDHQTDLLDLYAYPDGSTRLHVWFASDGLALRDPIGVAFPVGAMPWSASRFVAGDLNNDGRADVATLTAGGDGVTHVALLASGGKTLSYAPDAWVTPANEVQQIACVNCWPLNGTPIAADGPNVHRRPLAVKIDNAPTARPHYGHSQADMVWELLVEGFITRLAAYYHSQDPGTIGAVRSVRFSDRYTTPMVRGSLVFSGASQLMESLVRQDIANGAYVGVSPQLGEGGSFYRTNVDGRVAPHNLFTSSQALRSATNDVGGGGPVDVPRWDFLRQANHVATAGGFIGSVPATSLVVPYRADARVRYDYDANAKIYLRYQSNGVRPVLEVDGANGAWIMAKNVVIITTDVWVTDVVDDAGGAPSLDMRLTGSGSASIFRDGLRQDGTWSRATYFDPFTFTNFYGQKIYLSPGQTWVHVVPMDWQVPSSP